MAKWLVYNKRADFKAIGEKYHIDPVVARILVNRDVGDDASIAAYLHPSKKDFGDAGLLQDMDKAIALLQKAIQQNTKIRIIGDYDIDGIQSTYILHQGLLRVGADADYAIPDRIEDGYGVNIRLMERCVMDGIGLVITCDNGIAAAEAIAYAKKEGLTVIVTDHHEVPYELVGGKKEYHLPPADAVIDPKREDCAYPCKKLCGAVVAWKVILQLYQQHGIPEEEAMAFIENAAFATIGGQFLSALWQLAFLFGKRTIIPLNATLLKLQLNISKQIIQTGIPAFLMQISNSVLNIILNASLVKYGGDLALSAIGIVTSIQTLILMPITGLMQGQQPLISYNYGALKMNRVKETLKYAIIGATMIALIGFIAVQFFTKSIVYMFNDEADVVKLCSHALHIWFMCLPLIGAQVMCANYFQAIGKIKISSVLNLLRQIIILIPCIIIFSSIIGLDGIFIAVPVADLSAFIITVLLLKNALKKEA